MIILVVLLEDMAAFYMSTTTVAVAELGGLPLQQDSTN
jgi:hypothetical protein